MVQGEIVGLRAIERDDLPQLLAWRNKPNLRRYFREFRELNMDNQIRWYESSVLADETMRMFAIEELSSRELIGACGLCYIDCTNKSADFSIYIGKNDLYIDKTYAPDAGRTLLTYGFEELNLHRISNEVFSSDIAKQALSDAIGFTLEGRHRESRWIQGEWVDSLYYGILRQEVAGSGPSS